MAGEDLRVNAEHLRTHGAQLDRIGDRVEKARSAGDAVRLGADAYGQFCAVVPAIIGALQSVLNDVLVDARNSLFGSANQIRASAQLYEEAEAEQQQRIERLHRSVRGHR